MNIRVLERSDTRATGMAFKLCEKTVTGKCGTDRLQAKPVWIKGNPVSGSLGKGVEEGLKSDRVSICR